MLSNVIYVLYFKHKYLYNILHAPIILDQKIHNGNQLPKFSIKFSTCLCHLLILWRLLVNN